MAIKYPFTEEQKAQLSECYHNTNSKELAERFNCSLRKIYNLANDLGLKKDMEYIRKISRINMMRADNPSKKFWIKKGNIPANKGKRQVEYMTPEQIERTKPTRFKKGQLVWNRKQVGTERINTYGYTVVKVSEPDKWKLKHRIVWEKQNGKIPKGYNIQFKDCNRQNCDIDNLYMISRVEQLKNENSHIAKYPKEIQLAIQAKGALNRQINKYLNLNTNENE